MAQTLDALARSSASLHGIRSVVHTMKTLSVINAAPYENAAAAIEAYRETVLLGLHAFLDRLGAPDTAAAPPRTRALVVFGSDHGLCGSYNDALASHVREHLGKTIADCEILCVGGQMADALTDLGMPPRATVFPPASVDGIGRLANLLTRRLAGLQRDGDTADIAVSLAHVARDDTQGHRPSLEEILPLSPDLVRNLATTPWTSRSLPSFSMPPAALFEALIKGYLFASLFRAAAEALVTENAARLAQMQQAEQSVDDRLHDLAAETRAVRQSEITTELLDVIIGFEALKKRKEHSVSPPAAVGRAENHSKSGQKRSTPLRHSPDTF